MCLLVLGAAGTEGIFVSWQKSETAEGAGGWLGTRDALKARAPQNQHHLPLVQASPLVFRLPLLPSKPPQNVVAQSSHFILLANSVGQEFRQGTAVTVCFCSRMFEVSAGNTPEAVARMFWRCVHSGG